ncbi:transmembrane protein 121-like isoform X2 [Paroedura picta]
MELLPPTIPHTCMAAVVIVCTMGAMDVYLVEQSAGARRLGVCTLALAGDLFFLLVLRYATVWLGGEARLAQRGYAMVLWFLFAFALEIKLYFIYQHYATEGQAPDPLARHTLTLLLSICIPALYTVLGATELVAQAAASFRKKDELRGRLFWVVLDLLDVLEIQASLWEPQQRVLPLWAEGLTFFYCYGLLLVLPCVSLSELGVQSPRDGTLYPLLSLASVNVATIFIRGGLLLLCHDQRISSIFMGKNLLAIALKSCAVLQQHHAGAPAARGTCHTCPTCSQSQGHTQATEERQHRQAQTAAEIHDGQSTAHHSRECAPATADQSCKRTTSDQPHEHTQAKSKANHRNAAIEMLPKQAQAADEQSHRNAQPTGCQLHRHCYTKESSCMQHSPRDLPTTVPSTARALRTGYRVQLKSVWDGP